MRPLRPVILTDLAAAWPALDKWTPDFFKRVYGNKRVKIYDPRFVVPGKRYMSNARVLPLREYMDLVMTSSTNLRMFLYNLRREIPELIEDIVFPSVTSGLSKNFVFMFFGCNGAVTQMHFDIDMSHVFHTSIYGRKTITLFPHSEARNLYRHPFTCRSYVDVHDPDLRTFPRLANAEGWRDVLEPGETLFMPAGCWHHVVYDEPCCAVSLRCASQSGRARFRGFLNLFVMSPVDRVMNRLASEQWFRWKERRACLNT